MLLYRVTSTEDTTPPLGATVLCEDGDAAISGGYLIDSVETFILYDGPSEQATDQRVTAGL